MHGRASVAPPNNTMVPSSSFREVICVVPVLGSDRPSLTNVKPPLVLASLNTNAVMYERIRLIIPASNAQDTLESPLFYGPPPLTRDVWIAGVHSIQYEW